MAILVTCKNEEDPIKNEGTRVLTRLYLKIELITLVTCKNEEDPIKNEGARVLTAFLVEI